MTTKSPNTIQSTIFHYFPPKGEYQRFQDENHYAEKMREWGLTSTKKEFMYKHNHVQRHISIKGYETFGETAEFNTIVIEFEDGNLTCIHPAYLKEMQSSSFGKESRIQVETIPSGSELTDSKQEAVVVHTSPVTVATKSTKAKKEKSVKLVLPEDKVHFTANVKQFALSWNHFNEENDEVVVLENVQIVGEEPLEVGLAWCSHSKTLKKFELSPGDILEFDGKIVKKGLPKGKEIEDENLRLDVSVSYKINNPSKLKKI